MIEEIEFFLNDDHVVTDVLPTHTLLDFIRYKENKMGTKIGCREGDCGICSVLVGKIKNGKLVYSPIVSCLTPIVNVVGKHVVTIEGLNLPKKLNLFQSEMVKEGGTQCGFCTPGFIVSLIGYLISNESYIYSEAIHAIDGNICRCTGYKSIERAVKNTIDYLNSVDKPKTIPLLIEEGVIPKYFANMYEKLSQISLLHSEPVNEVKAIPIGGGTDLYVQIPDELPQRQMRFMKNEGLDVIKIQNSTFTVGATTTPTELLENPNFQELIPNYDKIYDLFASTQIRNVATIGGNLANASPIGDFTIAFLALNSQILLSGNAKTKKMPLNEFYLGYKDLNKADDQIVEGVEFEIPKGNFHFNFEKVSKRIHLDIASVNSAISLQLDENNHILSAGVSAGGVAPVPLYLQNTVHYLIGKKVSSELVKQIIPVAMDEISPIDDIRGSAKYKRLLLRQLMLTHFITLFPDLVDFKEVYQ